jgi:hypothetical protein
MNDENAREIWLRKRVSDSCDATNRTGAESMQKEKDLYTTKWFDYRFLTPTEADALFKAEYEKAYQSAWGTYQDRREAEFKTGLFSIPKFRVLTSADKTKLQREYTSISRARQSADVIGVPYDFLIRETIEALMASGHCHTLPRPNQIAGALTGEAIPNRVMQRWTDWAISAR